MSSKKFNAFISYSRNDGVDFVKNLMQKLADDLDGKHLKLWKDRDQMEGDKSWWQQITEACDECEYMILVLTPEALISTVCQREWRYAREQGVCVRPVKGITDSKIEYKLLPAGMHDAHIYDIELEWRKFVNDLNKSCSANRLVFMAAPLPGDYIERKEIFDMLKNQLLAEERKNIALSSVLKGAGGFGKTTMAIAICHNEEIKERYYSGILWATIGEDGNLQREITKIYRALTGDGAKVFIDEEEGARALSEKIEQGKYLLILDDVWKYTDINLLTEKLNSFTASAVLITTRIDSVVLQLNSTECEVNELSSDQALKYFTAGWHIDVTHQNLVDDILKAADGWLILLRLIRSAVGMNLKKGESLVHALTDLREIYISEGLTAFDVRNPRNRNEAIEKCIEASFRFLKQEEKEKCISLGIFPTDIEIPLEVIYSLWQLNSLAGKRLLQLLDDYSLLNLDLGKNVVRFHDVFLNYYEEKLGGNLTKTHSRLIDTWNDPFILPNHYSWNYYIWHLKKSGKIKTAIEFLQNFKWITAKLFAENITELLKDYEYFILDPDISMIYQALKFSAPVLSENKNQIAAQLLGRLVDSPNEVIKTITLAAKNWDKGDILWLRPKTSSLIPPCNLEIIIKVKNCRKNALIVKGEKLIAGSDDNTIRIWDMRTGLQIGEALTGHQDRIIYLTVYDGKIISASDDKTIRIWKLDTAKQMGDSLEGHTSYITHVLVSNGKIISASNDRTIRIWDINNGRQIGEPLKGHESWILHLEIYEEKIISRSADTVRIWDINTGKLVDTLITDDSQIRRFQISNGKIIAACFDGKIRIWDLNENEQSAKVLTTNGTEFSQLLVSHGKIMTVSSENSIRIWDMDSGNQVGVPIEGYKGGINQFEVNDGKIILGSKDIRIWDIFNSRQIGEPIKKYTGHFIISEGKIISQYDETTIQIHDLASSYPVGNLFKGHIKQIQKLLLSDGKIISGCSETVRVWNFESATQKETFSKLHFDRVTQLDVYNGVIISKSFNEILIWDPESGGLIEEPLKKYGYLLEGIDLNGETINSWVSGIKSTLVSQGRIIVLFADDSIQVLDIPSGNPIGRSLLLPKQPSFIGVGAMINDNKIIVASIFGNSLLLLELNSGKIISPLKNSGISQLLISEEMVVCACTDGQIRILDTNTGKQIGQSLQGHTGTITQLKIYDRKIISGSDDASIRIWNIDTGKLICEPLTGHKKEITSLVVHKGTIISGSADTLIRTWDLTTGKQVGEPLVGHSDSITALLVCDGKIISGSSDKTIRIWEMLNHSNSIAFVADAGISCMVHCEGKIIAGDELGKLHFLDPMGFSL